MNKGKWIRFGMLLAAAVLYIGAVFFCQSAKEDANLTYIVLSQNIDAAAAEEIFEGEKLLEDSVGFCLWGEAATQMVSCKETGSIAGVTQVLLSGNPGLMDAGVLAWRDGCFIDEATAQKLFGTADCGGQTLWQDDVPYQVFGTISALQPAMLTVAAEKDGAVLNRCVLSVTAENGAQAASQFLMRWGLQGELIDFYPIWAAVHNFLLLLPGIFLLRVFLYGVKDIRRILFADGFQASSTVKPAILLITTGCLLAFLGSRIIILPDMIPSRWSDFSFWGSWLEAQEENLRQVMLTPMGNTHLQMMLNMVKSLLSSTAALLLTLWALRRQENANTADRR